MFNQIASGSLGEGGIEIHLVLGAAIEQVADGFVLLFSDLSLALTVRFPSIRFRSGFSGNLQSVYRHFQCASILILQKNRRSSILMCDCPSIKGNS